MKGQETLSDLSEKYEVSAETIFGWKSELVNVFSFSCILLAKDA